MLPGKDIYSNWSAKQTQDTVVAVTAPSSLWCFAKVREELYVPTICLLLSTYLGFLNVLRYSEKVEYLKVVAFLCACGVSFFKLLIQKMNVIE